MVSNIITIGFTISGLLLLFNGGIVMQNILQSPLPAKNSTAKACIYIMLSILFYGCFNYSNPDINSNIGSGKSSPTSGISCTSVSDCCNFGPSALCDTSTGRCVHNPFCAQDFKCYGSRWGTCGENNNNGTNPQHQSDEKSVPCYATGLQASAYEKRYASQYAMKIIGLASQLGGISGPSAVYEMPGLNNASYQYNNDEITYDPNWLTNFNTNTGFAEAGDSIIYHEVGHMWAKKSGISTRIGFGTVENNWKQEFQADSFAGYILRSLGGDVRPSIAVYTTVMSNWGSTHPPGEQRARIFYQAWLNQAVQTFALTEEGFSDQENWFYQYYPIKVEDYINSSKITRIFIINKLQFLRTIRNKIIGLGLNPYSIKSDNVFRKLLLNSKLH